MTSVMHMVKCMLAKSIHIVHGESSMCEPYGFTVHKGLPKHTASCTCVYVCIAGGCFLVTPGCGGTTAAESPGMKSQQVPSVQAALQQRYMCFKEKVTQGKLTGAHVHKLARVWL